MRAAGCLAVVAALGCSSESASTPTSDSLPLASLTLSVSAQGNGEAVLVQVLLYQGSTYVSLGGADRLLARTASSEVPLVPLGIQNVGLLPAVDRLDVVLDRGATPGVVHVALPAPFGLVGPNRIRRKEPLTFTWGPPDPTSAAPELLVDGACLSSAVYRRPASDTGTHTFDPADLFVTPPCDALFRVTRSLRTGALSFEGLAGATGGTAQVRTLTFRIDP